MNSRKTIPCPYSRFVFLSGVCIALGLFLSAAALERMASLSHSTTACVSYITAGNSCIEAAFASLVCALMAAVIGEAVFRGRQNS